MIGHGILAMVCVTAGACDSLPVYSCPRVSCGPVIDGRLDEAVWQGCPPVRLVLSTTGKPASRETVARMCWDERYLYIGFECEDTDVWGTLVNRDDPVYSEEVVEAFLAPECDLVHYYEINVSPRNTVFDGFIVNPSAWEPTDDTDFGWNCEGIRTAVMVDGTLDDRTDTDRGWSVEIAVPFAGLGRSTPRPGERWRANLYRIDLSPEPAEFQAWSPTLASPPRFHVPTRFGTVFFVNGD